MNLLCSIRENFSSRSGKVLLSLAVVGALAGTIAGCDDIPTSFAVPIFNTGISIPLKEDSITIEEMVDDSTVAKFVKNIDGNLSLYQTSTLNPTRIGDSLKLNAVDISYTTTVNGQRELLEEIADLGSTTVKLTDIFPDIPPSPTVIEALGPEGKLTEISLNLPENIEYVKFSKGTLQIVLKNRMPVSAEFRTVSSQPGVGFVIVTPGEEDIFVPLNSQQSQIPANSSRGENNDPGGPIQINLAGKRISNQSKVQVMVSSPGSNGQAVPYTDNSGAEIISRISDVGIEEAKIGMESRRISFPVETIIPGKTELTEADVTEFSGNFKITNNLPVSGTAVLKLSQFISKSTGKPYTSKGFNIPRKNSTNISFSSEGDTYLLKPDSIDIANGGVIRSVRVMIDLMTNEISNDNKAVFRGTDEFTAAGKISTVRFSRAKGNSLSQTQFNVSSAVKFNLDSSMNNLSYQELKFKRVKIEATLLNRANITAMISGKAQFIGKKGNIIDEIPIPTQQLNPGTTNSPVETKISFSKSPLILTELPDSIRIIATATTVENIPFDVHSEDDLSGVISATIPLEMTLLEGTKRDTADFYNKEEGRDSRESLQDRQKNIILAQLRIEALNKIPANVGVVMRFFENGNPNNEILRIPSEGKIMLSAAEMNTEGFAVKERRSFQAITLDSSQIRTILNSGSKYIIEYSLNVANDAGGEYVNFTTADKIRVRVGFALRGNTDF